MNKKKLDHILKSTENELMQIKSGFLTTCASSISSNGSQLTVGNLLPNFPASTNYSSTLCSQDSSTGHSDMLVRSTSKVKGSFAPIIEETAIDVDNSTPAQPNECGVITHGVTGFLSSTCMDSAQPEQNLGPQEGAGKALKYIMENSFRLERAAFGLAPGSTGCSPRIYTYGDDDKGTCDISGKKGKQMG